MRSLLSLVVLLFAAIVSAASTSGNRLLVVADDVADKDAYSKFFGDLAGEITRRIGGRGMMADQLEQLEVTRSRTIRRGARI